MNSVMIPGYGVAPRFPLTGFLRAQRLDEVVDDTPVRVVPGKHTHLARPDPIPFHTDHPKADIILWRCEAQDGRDGASLLVDGRRVIEELDPREHAGLERLILPAMVRLGDEATPTPIITRDGEEFRLFYAPWLEPVGRPVEHHGVLVTFRQALARHEKEGPCRLGGVTHHALTHKVSLIASDTRKPVCGVPSDDYAPTRT